MSNQFVEFRRHTMLIVAWPWKSGALHTSKQWIVDSGVSYKWSLSPRMLFQSGQIWPVELGPFPCSDQPGDLKWKHRDGPLELEFLEKDPHGIPQCVSYSSHLAKFHIYTVHVCVYIYIYMCIYIILLWFHHRGFKWSTRFTRPSKVGKLCCADMKFCCSAWNNLHLIGIPKTSSWKWLPYISNSCPHLLV